MKKTTIYLTEKKKKIFKEITYLTDESMSRVINKILDDNNNLENYLEKARKKK